MKHTSIYDVDGNPLPGIHVTNLRKLGEALYYDDILPKYILRNIKFNMMFFTGRNNCESYNCGSAGCAIGWAPFVGIAKDYYEEWSVFSYRTLIDVRNLECWHWCFSGHWGGVDNSRRGAGKRILYLLERGLPDSYAKSREVYMTHGALLQYKDYLQLYENFTPCLMKRKTSPKISHLTHDPIE